jgi:hypothetical protein
MPDTEQVTSTDRELLEAAARAAGYQVARIADNDDDLLLFGHFTHING